MDRLPVLGGTALGGAGLLCCVVLAGDGPPLVFLRLALVPLAAAAAFVLDEPASAAVDAVPRTRRSRTWGRAVVVGLPLTVWAGGVVAADLRVPATPAVAMLVEGAGVLAVAVALAALLRWLDRPEPGESVASAIGGALLALLVFDLPAWWPVPLFPGDTGWPASTVLWSGLIVVAAVLLGLSSADPYRLRS